MTTDQPIVGPGSEKDKSLFELVVPVCRSIEVTLLIPCATFRLLYRRAGRKIISFFWQHCHHVPFALCILNISVKERLKMPV